ncbi:hypothetical protein N0V90_010894 [Kalmusia sp. IMI 367209]|nr:hypothetical protein N0V90_010894 [Kalmusia sp. IMI 367209]
MAQKSVAIIGAGPGGLIAARKLMKLTPFKFVIFEKTTRVGGLWDRNSFIHPEMVTNFCRYTATFSDFAWESVDFGRPAPVYPQAWMVEKYLQEYGKLIPEGCYEFDTCVTRAAREDGKWKVVAVNNGEEKTRHFDYLVVATGYLSIPKALKCEMDAVRATESLNKSSQWTNARQKAPRTVLVIGGSHSGADVSGLIAHQASDAQWSPQGNEYCSGVKIVHVMQNTMLPVPGMVRNRTAEHVSFHPLEFTLCERSTRGAEPLSFVFGPAGFQEKQGLMMFYKEVIEGGAGDFDFDDDLPPFAIISDRYYQHVQAGTINPVIGMVKRLEKGKDSHSITAIVESKNGGRTIIDNIAAVINATGFNSSGGLDFLADEIKVQLEFDAENTRLPVVLDASYMAQHSKAPDIALLGFVPVNWGIMEMQCRAVASRWTGRPFDEDPKDVAALGAYIRNMRHAIKDVKRRAEVPQFLFGDYLGLIEQAARELKMTKINGTYGDFDGFLCSARYVGLGEERGEAIKTMYAVQHLQKEIHAKNRLLAQVVFQGLLGRWRSESQNNGAAHEIDAHPRYPTASGYDLEYVMVIKKNLGELGEEDTLIARYAEVTDEITLWAVDQGQGLKTGSLICAINFGRDEDGEIRETSGMFCSGLSFTYNLRFRGSRLDGFIVVRKMGDAPDESFAFGTPNMEPMAERVVVEPDQKEWSVVGKLGVQANGKGETLVRTVL